MIKQFCLVAIIAVFISLELPAQLAWKSRDSSFGPLPGSIHLFQYTGLFENTEVNLWYVSIRLDDRSLQFDVKTSTRTPEQYHQNYPGAFVLVNGGLFDTTNFRLVSTVIRNSELLSYNITALRSNQSGLYYYPTRSAFGISKDRNADIAWLFTDTSRRWPYGFQAKPVLARGKQPSPILADLNTLDEWKEWKMRTAVGGGPVVVHDSRVRITNQEEQLYPTGVDDPDARTVIGYTADKRLIILAAEGSYTGRINGISLFQAATIMQSIGCVEAMNLNVGNKAFLFVNGKETIKPIAKNVLIPVVFAVEPAKHERRKSKWRIR